MYALDLTRPGAPQKWTYEPHPEAAAQDVACCDVVNRGVVYWDGKVIFNTLDGNTSRRWMRAAVCLRGRYGVPGRTVMC